MKNYTITVNGTAYDVTVEENTSTKPKTSSYVLPKAVSPYVQPQAAAPQAAPQAAPKAAPQAAPKAQPQAAPQAAVPKAAPTAGTGAVKINASLPGKVVKLDANVGQAVKAGDSIIVLEAMKMEIPVVAPQDGTVTSIDVAVGNTVESGDLLASLN